MKKNSLFSLSPSPFPSLSLSQLPSMVLTAIWILSAQAAMAAGELELGFTLFPTGSFKAKCRCIEGRLGGSGEGQRAETLKVKVTSLKTENELRDKHLHEKLKSKGADFIYAKNVQVKGGRGSATFQVGQKSKIMTFDTKKEGNTYTASFTLKMSDFGIENVSYLGVGVEDEISVTVKIL